LGVEAQIAHGERYAEIVRRLHAELVDAAGTAVPVRLWDGRLLGDPSAGFEIVLRRPCGLRAMLLPPTDLAAGEAYLRGDIDITGDLVAALRAAADVVARLSPAARLRLARGLLALPAPARRDRPARARLHGRRHSLQRDRAAIAYHYDHPEAFYEQFLDAALVYSCAYFADPAEPLETAQRRKLDLVCRKLRLRPGQRLLDIGCGWGSLLVHAARRYGVRAVGVTLSTTQAEAGRERVRAAGLEGQVGIRLADYRELHERFDAVASIGMVEHVGPENLLSYGRAVAALTEPGGPFLLHGIVLGDADRLRSGRERSFLSAHVFPDGGLAPVWRVTREMERAGWSFQDAQQLRPHYALTLREWVRRLEANRETATAVAGEEAYRTWRIYMAASALSFEQGALGVLQLLGANGRVPRAPLPLGRAWMEPTEERP
jgi:cyclopropane-fatty-acyl-phospholipid synthase